MRINTNVGALTANRYLQRNDFNLSKSLEKLSSGLRINRASDDAGGLSISETLRGQIKGLSQAEKNIQDGIGLINTAEGALNEVSNVLQRMRELAVQSANGTLTASDRAAIGAEYDTLKGFFDTTGTNTDFNTLTVFTAAATSTFTLQVGANGGETLIVTTGALASNAVGGQNVSASTVTTSAATASTAIQTLDRAISQIALDRARLGAQTNRLEYTINTVATTRENLAAAESRIRDVDMASEMSTMTRNQILMQSSTAMLAQANAKPQSILSLFR